MGYKKIYLYNENYTFCGTKLVQDSDKIPYQLKKGETDIALESGTFLPAKLDLQAGKWIGTTEEKYAESHPQKSVTQEEFNAQTMKSIASQQLINATLLKEIAVLKGDSK